MPREPVYVAPIDWDFITAIVFQGSIFFAEIGFLVWAIYKVAS